MRADWITKKENSELPFFHGKKKNTIDPVPQPESGPVEIGLPAPENFGEVLPVRGRQLALLPRMDNSRDDDDDDDDFPI